MRGAVVDVRCSRTNRLFIKAVSNDRAMTKALDDCGFDIVTRQLRNAGPLGTHVALKSEETARTILAAKQAEEWIDTKTENSGYIMLWTPQDISGVKSTIREILSEPVDLAH